METSSFEVEPARPPSVPETEDRLPAFLSCVDTTDTQSLLRSVQSSVSGAWLQNFRQFVLQRLACQAHAAQTLDAIRRVIENESHPIGSSLRAMDDHVTVIDRLLSAADRRLASPQQSRVAEMRRQLTELLDTVLSHWWYTETRVAFLLDHTSPGNAQQRTTEHDNDLAATETGILHDTMSWLTEEFIAQSGRPALNRLTEQLIPGFDRAVAAAGALARLTATSSVLDLKSVAENPDAHDFEIFRGAVKKLILSGTREGEHIAILWYPESGGSVDLHHHWKTESVVVVDGAQSDPKGTYNKGVAYFNPPGSDHSISNSHGLFLLAYASPPDFAFHGKPAPYEPVVIDIVDPALNSKYEFRKKRPGVRKYKLPLAEEGGLRASLIELSLEENAEYTVSANYVLPFHGEVHVDGVPIPQDTLVTAKSTTKRRFTIRKGRNREPAEPATILAVKFGAKSRKGDRRT